MGRKSTAVCIDQSASAVSIIARLNRKIIVMKIDSQPSPHLFFNTITGYQAAAALRAALDLDVFTLLANAPMTAQEIANQSNAALRGIRILCDQDRKSVG